MSHALLFHYLMLNMFRMLICPSSGACYLFFELFHGLYCSGYMRVGVTLWFGWSGVVSLCFSLHTDTTPPQPNHNVTPTHIEPEQYNPWNNSTKKTQALNNEIKKQVTSSWSLFIQLNKWGLCSLESCTALAGESRPQLYLMFVWPRIVDTII